jgi:tRNA pseudouridine13 synthase
VDRYLTQSLPGIGGSIKERVEDFIVEEIPLYQPRGEGQHTFFEIQKAGLSTFQAVQAIARGLGVSPRLVSYAGLKDSQATTCQVLSVEGVPPEAVLALDLPDIQILWAERHGNRLKIGHLRGNRFTIRIRDVDERAMVACQEILEVLAERGVPNRFGPQRFGLRGNSGKLGRAVVHKNAHEFIQVLLGHPHASESGRIEAARQQFESGHWEQALHLFPSNMAQERQALQILIRSKGDVEKAYAAVPKRLKMFFLSAYQSELFNHALDARLQTLDRVYEGDLAMKHPGRSVFLVEDETVEQPRAASFEISPTGPIFGYKMIGPSGRQGELEAEILAVENLTLESFRIGGGLKARGERRALRFEIHEPESWYDEGIMLRFWLTRGCYATTVLGEIMKVPLF